MTVTSESIQWLFIVYRQDWVCKKMKGKEGWNYFNKNISISQTAGDEQNETDNHWSNAFSRFIESWNMNVTTLHHKNPSSTYATVSQSQDAFRMVKKVERATFHPHTRNCDGLSWNFRDDTINRTFLPNFPAAFWATCVNPNPPAVHFKPLRHETYPTIQLCMVHK